MGWVIGVGVLLVVDLVLGECDVEGGVISGRGNVWSFFGDFEEEVRGGSMVCGELGGEVEGRWEVDDWEIGSGSSGRVWRGRFVEGSFFWYGSCFWRGEVCWWFLIWYCGMYMMCEWEWW